MEILTIESKAFNLLIEKIERIENFVKRSKELNDDFNSEGILLDTNQACDLLDISDRTLWKLRKANVIEYTYHGKRCIYKLSELEKIITNQILPCGIKSVYELRAKYLITFNNIPDT